MVIVFRAPDAGALSFVNAQALSNLQARSRREFDHEVGDAVARDPHALVRFFMCRFFFVYLPS